MAESSVNSFRIKQYFSGLLATKGGVEAIEACAPTGWPVDSHRKAQKAEKSKGAVDAHCQSQEVGAGHRLIRESWFRRGCWYRSPARKGALEQLLCKSP